jgi:hypothetical protein
MIKEVRHIGIWELLGVRVPDFRIYRGFFVVVVVGFITTHCFSQAPISTKSTDQCKNKCLS